MARSVMGVGWRRSLIAASAFVVVLLSASQPAGAAAERTFRGRYLLRHTDAFASGKATFRPVLELEDGRIVRLAFEAPSRARIAPGSIVDVRAVVEDGSLVVADGGTEIVSEAATVVAAPAQRDVAVLLFNFSNDRSEPYTKAHARGVAFTNSDSVATYYAEASYGQLSLAGDVFGWYQLADDNAGCATEAWKDQAMAAATADGVALSSYEHVVFGFPAAPSCAWAGLAQLPGRYSWLNGTSAMALRVFAHELGHNLGTHHASTLNCSSSGSRVVIVSDVATCTADEYGDPFTVMGAASRMHPTNFSRGNFGWLSSGNTLTVTESGDHTLTPVATPDAGVKAIRIARTTDAYLLLEFRQPFGTQFETFGATSPVASGVSVRIVPAYTSRTRSYLLDTTPTTTSFADAPLAVGTTLVDPLTGVSITTLSTGTAGATVRVTFPGSTPTPSPSASPSPTPPPGDTEPPTAPSTVTATGLDHRRIRLTWTASSDNVGVQGYQVLRGGTAVGTVTGTTFTDTGLAPSTSYAYEVVAYDAAGNDSSSAGASGSTLARKDTRPPRPPKDLRSVRDDLTVTLRWRPSTDDVGVAGYRVFRNDRMIAVVDRPRFEDHLGRPGMRPTYRVRAFDAAGNVSRWSARIRA